MLFVHTEMPYCLFCFELNGKIIATVLNKTLKNVDRIVEMAAQVNSLVKCTHHYGKMKKSKKIQGKVLSIYNKKTKTGCNNRHVHVQFDLGGASTKVADMSIRSIQAAPEEEGNTAEGLSVAVAEE